MKIVSLSLEESDDIIKNNVKRNLLNKHKRKPEHCRISRILVFWILYIYF